MLRENQCHEKTSATRKPVLRENQCYEDKSKTMSDNKEADFEKMVKEGPFKRMFAKTDLDKNVTRLQ